MPVRILIVDDCAPLRRTVRQLLERRRDFLIVGEAEDGLEAIQQTRDLDPDVILLDINLPRLNGIEAAKQIRKWMPRTAIIFLSISFDPEVLRAAFHTGGNAYVLKARADEELCQAIEMVLGGTDYVAGADGSRGFDGSS